MITGHIIGQFGEWKLERELAKLRQCRLKPLGFEVREEIIHAYEHYILNYSTEKMAASLESMIFAFQLCVALKPANILDLGSGFSSYVFRLYAQAENGEVEVVSVDDNKEWLYKTSGFLEGVSLRDNNLFEWHEFFEKGTGRGFELVFYDLGRMPVRFDNLVNVAGCLADNGIMIIDDVHKRHYAKHVRNIIKRELNWPLIDLRKRTKDKYGRFSCLTRKVA